MHFEKQLKTYGARDFSVTAKLTVGYSLGVSVRLQYRIILLADIRLLMTSRDLAVQETLSILRFLTSDS